MIRTDGRSPEEMRPVAIERNYIPHAEGSALIQLGGTKVLCVATYEEGVPSFLKGSSRGWVTAEYAMLPRATNIRSTREVVLGRQGGRSMEIQRLIGRSLRAVVDAEQFPDHTFWVDCDVIQADGGTRTAAITGAWVALHDAFETLANEGVIEGEPIKKHVAAISIGVVQESLCLDLCFEEDYHADVDLNLVADEQGDIIEIQGTAEGVPVKRATIERMIDLGLAGVADLIEYQKQLISGNG